MLGLYLKRTGVVEAVICSPSRTASPQCDTVCVCVCVCVGGVFYFHLKRVCVCVCVCVCVLVGYALYFHLKHIALPGLETGKRIRNVVVLVYNCCLLEPYFSV